MKAHFGVDSRSKLIHAVVATPANVADSKVLPDLLHGSETRVWGDQAYRGQRAVIRQHAPRAQDFINRRYRYRGVVDEIERAKNRTKSKVRAKVEHPIVIIKRVFGFANATAGSERTLIASLSPVRSPTCSSNAGISCATMWRNLSGSTTTGCRRRRRHTNNRAANPALSLAAAMAMADIYPQLPYSDPP